MSEKRICNGHCKKFRVTKPYGIGRYEAGQGRCQTCDIWIDRRGAHTKNGGPVMDDSEGWFCNCCNYRIRRKPRNIKYKAKMRSTDSIVERNDIDLAYFNKHRAEMIQTIVRLMHEERDKMIIDDLLAGIDRTNLSISEIKTEFGVTIDKIIDLAYTLTPPNKISLAREFERVRKIIDNTPTKHDIENYTTLHISQYEEEFGSWEHFLDRMGDDPWYRNQNTAKSSKLVQVQNSESNNMEDMSDGKDLDSMRKDIRNSLADIPDMLHLFDVMDANIMRCRKEKLKQALDSLN